MSPVELIAAGVVLFAAVAVGTVIHELSHAAVLRAFAVPYEVVWLPMRTDVGALRAGLTGGWAAVRLGRVPPSCSPWALRVASLVPLLLAMPLPLVLCGVLPDPLRVGNPYLTAATIGWLACAVPSPEDFSLFWHAERALARADPSGDC